MGALAKFFKDLVNLHIGRSGVHRWQKWRDREWCAYCGKDA